MTKNSLTFTLNHLNKPSCKGSRLCGRFPLFIGASKKTRGEYMGNPRYKNGARRRKIRARLKAQRGVCGICRGRLGPIHWDEPSDSMHPLSFVVDEIHPVSRWRQYGYSSPTEAALDWNNVQAAHYICNLQKGARDGWVSGKNVQKKEQNNILDGDW